MTRRRRVCDSEIGQFRRLEDWTEGLRGDIAGLRERMGNWSMMTANAAAVRVRLEIGSHEELLGSGAGDRRKIANKSFPMLPVQCVLWTYEYRAVNQFPLLRTQVRRAKLDWAQVADLMVQRRLIAAEADPWEDVGVEWTTPSSTATALTQPGRVRRPGLQWQGRAAGEDGHRADGGSRNAR